MSFVVGLATCNEPSSILSETLCSICDSSVQPERVFIIDNGDAERADLVGLRHIQGNVRQAVPVQVIRPMRNTGFAGACNLLRRLGQPHRTICVNADCSIPTDAFEKMLAIPPPAAVLGFAFGCFFIDDEIWKKVGEFDEEFYPAYFEDTDYRRRMKLADVETIEWPVEEASRLSFGRAMYSTGFAHGWRHETKGYQMWTDDKLAWFYSRLNANRQRYIDKWGGEVGHETHMQPFGEK
jgi:GT2 family glycosyltransferase